MKYSSWQKLLLALFFVCFACLFVTGAERLIADESPSSPSVRTSCPAFIGSIQSVHGEAEKLTRREHEPGRREERCEDNPVRIGCPILALRCDANGNVLCCRSYLHAVYQAFALGDGFV